MVRYPLQKSSFSLQLTPTASFQDSSNTGFLPLPRSPSLYLGLNPVTKSKLSALAKSSWSGYNKNGHFKGLKSNQWKLA